MWFLSLLTRLILFSLSKRYRDETTVHLSLLMSGRGIAVVVLTSKETIWQKDQYL